MSKVQFALNDHFYDFINDWSQKFYFLVGGYGSSKSYHVAAKLLAKLVEEKRKAMVVREVYETHRDSTFSLLKEVAEAMGLSDVIKFHSSPLRVVFPNGSEIIFRGMDNPEKLKSINGITIIWLEECSEIKYAGFKELLGRARHPKLSIHFLLSTNPVSKGNWSFKHFFEDTKNKVFILNDEELYQRRIVIKNNTYYHHSTCDDNYFLPESYTEQLDDMATYDPDLYRVARKGRFGINGKRVLPQFETAPHDEVMDSIKAIKNPLMRVGMDFGFVDSYNAVVRMAIDHDNKTLYLYWEYYDHNKTDDITAEDIAEFKETRERIKADSAEPKTIKFYRQMGFNMWPCKKFQGSRLAYTKKVKRFKRIVCSESCPNIIEELKDLTFATDKDGNIIEDEFNIDPHTFSAIWYGLDDYEVADLKGGMSILKPKERR